MDTEKTKDLGGVRTGEKAYPPLDYNNFNDFANKRNFISSMHKIPEGFSDFVDVSSSAPSTVVKESYEEPKKAEDNKERAASYNGHQHKKNSPASKGRIKIKFNKRTLFYNIVAAVFCVVLCLGSIATFVVKDREFSESENRVLEQRPTLTISSITDGSFMKKFETYLTDQFPLRDKAISLKTFVDRLIGVKKENGVYIGEDGFLFDSPTAYNKKDVEKKGKAISEFTQKYPKMKKAVVISPNSSYIYSDKLPADLKLPDQSKQLEKVKNTIKDTDVKFVDSVSALENARDNNKEQLLFYKTDHHWTTRGAYAVFKKLANVWKIDVKKAKYSFYALSDSFEGTLGSKSGLHSTKDVIEMCIPAKSVGTYVVNYESQQKKTATLFESEKLGQKNQYEVFLGGNFDKVVISTTCLNNQNLLIIKDSYANSMIPMLTAHFSKIVVVDPRYLTDSLDAIMKENDFTHILFLYNLNTFLEDSSLVDVLSE